MRKYANRPMRILAGELAAGLNRLKRGYVDAAEALAQLIDPRRAYPFEFVVYRLTGYRPPRGERPAESLDGAALRQDLLRLMLDVCDSFELRASAYCQAVYDTAGVAQRFRVSKKTIQRWRTRGLAARRLVMGDGTRHIAFLESSLRWFVSQRRQQVRRSMHFSQMSATERRDVIRRARRMARSADCSLIEASRRIAARKGRAVETVRYTLRNYDRQHPDEAIFAGGGVLDDGERGDIYRSYLRGTAVPTLARRHARTRSSIYRIINEMRARHLAARSIQYVYNPQFDLPNADDVILDSTADAGADTQRPPAMPKPSELPAYLRALYEVPLLAADRERQLFRRYNYLKYKADRLRRTIDVRRVNTARLKEIEDLLLRATAVKNAIVRANLRLVVSIARKHVAGPQTLFELVSDGNVSLMRAVEKFDYARGNRFSTYASWAIMRNFARSVPREKYHLGRFTTGHDEILDIAAALKSYDPGEINMLELRESIETVLTRLSPTERKVLVGHYGLEPDRPARTFEQLGRYLGMSKERVRQIEIKALHKLRTYLAPCEAELLK
ncbi:MAG: sigma-70 family RNA polymerase sigma factor [Phycisphaerae bacterium]|nr:sigma-70 family RNA polymerase sigma factor [Phycisphaerae bacterium]